MAYVTPAQVVTGQPITAETWNQDVVNNTLALYNTPGVMLGISNLTAPTALIGENTLIGITTSVGASYNSGVTVDISNEFLQAEVAGIYAIFAYGFTDTTTSANNGSLYLQTNDGHVPAIRTYQHPAVGAGHAQLLSVMGVKKMSVGDYVQCYFRQNLIASLGFNPRRFGMHWLGSGE